jgi:hypothetical protein
MQAQWMVQTALSSGAPRIYANGIGLALTGSDLILTLWCNGAVAAVVNLSFPTAQSLATDVGNVLADLSAGVGHPIPTPKDIQDGMARVQQSKSSAQSPGE